MRLLFMSSRVIFITNKSLIKKLFRVKLENINFKHAWLNSAHAIVFFGSGDAMPAALLPILQTYFGLLFGLDVLADSFQMSNLHNICCS